MAEAGQRPEKANTAVPHEGDHDRIAMLSLNADGTANQHNPEVILSQEAAVEASKRQFSEQAVSAADVELRGVTSRTAADSAIVGTEDGKPDEVVKASELPQDPQVEEATKAHVKAAQSATGAAEGVAKLVKS